MPDDTEPLKARLRELERENAMLKAAINSSPAGIVIASAPDGVIEFINPAALGIRGAPEDELTEIPIELHADRWQLFRADGTPFAADELPLSRAVLAGEKTSQGVAMFMDHLNGDRRWIEVHAAPVRDEEGRVVAGVAVFPDVTERKRTEWDLLRFRSMAEASPDFVGIAGADRKIIYINPAGWRICGYPGDFTPGDFTSDMLHSPAIARLIQEEAIPTARREGSWVGESDLVTRNGETIPVSQAIMYHCDPTGQQDYVSTVIRDLRPLRKLEADLNQSRRLESMGRLAGGVAHDFNNLLTVIQNYTLLVQEEIPKSAASHDDLQQVIEAAGRAADLCTRLLSFARRQLIQPTVVNVDEVVGQLSRLFSRSLGADVQLQVQLPADLWNLKMDRAQLDQILINLVVNAREAMPRGGRILIQGANEVVEGPDSSSSDGQLLSGEYVALTVSDTGVGMTPEVQARIFEPFFSTKGPEQGSGLGLATVHGAVRQNGGQIQVESTLGQGSQFKLFLPRSAEEPEPKVRSEPIAEPRARTVLVVEDEPSLRGLTVRLLERGGYKVLDAYDGRHALEVAAAYEDTIDLLVTDVIMPNMNGQTLAEELSGIRPGIRILFVSGYDEDQVAHHGVLASEVEFLAKPFAGKELLRRVSAVLA